MPLRIHPDLYCQFFAQRRLTPKHRPLRAIAFCNQHKLQQREYYRHLPYVLDEVREEMRSLGSYIAFNLEGSSQERTFSLSIAENLIAKI